MSSAVEQAVPDVSTWVVIKRDGKTTQPFDGNKIVKAILAAARGVVSRTPKGEAETTMKVEAVKDEDLPLLVASVVEQLKAGQVDRPIPIETIQDAVERALIAANLPEIAKAYILYRANRAKLRGKADVAVADEAAIAVNRKYFKTDLQIFQALNKYARWDDAKGRRENWEETTSRVINFMKWQVKNHTHGPGLTDEEWKELEDGMLNLHALPSMRLVQMAGPALERCRSGVYNCAFIAVDSLSAFPEILYVLMQGSGVGFSVESNFIEDLPKVRRQRAGAPMRFKVEDTTESWCEALRVGVSAWFNGKDVKFDTSAVRKAGTRLKTKGGFASGPGPLIELLDFARTIILSRQCKRLRTRDVHDICCKIGKVVVVGGVRRAAMLSLSDLDDALMRDCKQGQFWAHSPQRTMANNSAVYEEKPDSVTFMREWLQLIESGAGERGIFNRGGLLKSFPARRAKVPGIGVNPCLHPDERLHTSQGMVRVADLYDEGLPNLVVTDRRVKAETVTPGEFGTALRPATQVEMTQRNAPLVLVETEHGYRVRCTENHEFPLCDGGRKSAANLAPGDQLLLQSGEGRWGEVGSYRDGFVLGLITGDGTLSDTAAGVTQAFACVWEDDFSLLGQVRQSVVGMMTEVAAVNGRDYGPPAGTTCTLVGTKQKKQIGGVRLARYMHDRLGIEDVKSIKSAVPECVWVGCREMVVGYLHGLFAADGSVQVVGRQKKQTVSLRLSQSGERGLSLLRDVQQLLQNFGIVTRVYAERRPAGVRKLPNSQRRMTDYRCQSDNELIMSRPNLVTFLDRVGLLGPKLDKAKKLLAARGMDCRKPERFMTRVKSVTPAGRSDVYCLNEPETHSIVVGGVVTAQCGEVLLRSRQFCNLSIAVVREDDSAEGLSRKVRLAAMFGTIQSTMTQFRYLSKAWKKNCEEERLLGVDVAGVQDSPALKFGAQNRGDLLRRLKAEVIRTNQAFAAKLGIAPSAAATCNKPSGNSSVLLGIASGISPRWSPYYIRNVRVNSVEPMAQFLIDAGVPHTPEYDEPDPKNPRVWVFSFPVKSPEGSVFRKDMSAIDQLENWKAFKVYWTEHNPSVTVYVGEDEWFAAGAWVLDNWDIVGGLSFMPRDDSVYPLSPYQEITKKEYEKAAAAFPTIPWEKFARYERTDTTTIGHELACTAGVCERT